MIGRTGFTRDRKKGTKFTQTYKWMQEEEEDYNTFTVNVSSCDTRLVLSQYRKVLQLIFPYHKRCIKQGGLIDFD